MTRRTDAFLQIKKNPGLPDQGEPGFVIVGKLRRPHGVRGEISMEVLTDFPQRLRIGRQVYLGEKYLPVKIASIREKSLGILISFEGYDDCDKVGDLTNQMVYVPVRELPELPENEYYYHQLIGLTVETTQGQVIGRLEEILETGANDVFLVRNSDGQEILLPVIGSVIEEIDLKMGRVVVNPPEWG